VRTHDKSVHANHLHVNCNVQATRIAKLARSCELSIQSCYSGLQSKARPSSHLLGIIIKFISRTIHHAECSIRNKKHQHFLRKHNLEFRQQHNGTPPSSFLRTFYTHGGAVSGGCLRRRVAHLAGGRQRMRRTWKLYMQTDIVPVKYNLIIWLNKTFILQSEVH
jgi:hypothetical protein